MARNTGLIGKLFILTLMLSSLAASLLCVLSPISSQGQQAQAATPTSFNVTDTKVLQAGDDFVHGFIYYGDYLWASTRTSPCRILKIDPDTLDYEKVILDEGLNDGEDLIAANGYIWVILCTTPSQIIRVDPQTLDWEVAVEFQNDELYDGSSLAYAFGYLWAGGCDREIAKIDLSDLTYQIYSYPTGTTGSQFHALTSGGGYVWGSCNHVCNSWCANTVVRINPDDPTDYASVYISSVMPDDIAYVDGYLYTVTEEAPSYIYKISDNLSYSSAWASSTKCYGIFSGSNSSWGVYAGSPGTIAEFDSSLNVKATYQLPFGFNNANEAAFDNAGNIYITCWENPAKIVKLGCNLPSCSKEAKNNMPPLWFCIVIGLMAALILLVVIVSYTRSRQQRVHAKSVRRD
jgi:hypothetical protein